MKLDEYQLEAVKTLNNTLLIAGAGAGKTLTIVKKIEYLIDNNICKEQEILVISFTNKSVDDLKKKIDKNVDIYTFHKLAMHILDDYSVTYNLVSDSYLTYIANEFFYTLNDELMQIEILKYFKECNYNKFLDSYKYKEFIKVITTIIKIYKTNDLSKEDIIKNYHKDKFLSKYMYIIKNVYDSELKSNNSYDFDDLIINATNILDKFYKYKFIIVDEFQDTSIIRFNLVNKLREINKAILFVVGDDYQSIYHFSGCDINLFLDFPKLIPNSRVLYLKNTYRNSQELINIAASFIMKNKRQLKKDLISNKHVDKPIEFIYYINPKKAFKKLYKKVLTLLIKNVSIILVLERRANI